MANDSAVWGTMSNSWEISFIYSENNRHLIHKSTIMQHPLIRPIQKFNRMNILRHTQQTKKEGLAGYLLHGAEHFNHPHRATSQI